MSILRGINFAFGVISGIASRTLNFILDVWKFVVGGFIAIGAEVIFDNGVLGFILGGNYVEQRDKDFYILLSAIILFSAVAFPLMISLTRSRSKFSESIEKLENARSLVRMERDTTYDKGTSAAYRRCIEAIDRAENSVVVISAHNPKAIGTRFIESSHDVYLVKGLHKALVKNISASRKRFEYRRVIQCDPDVFDGVRDDVLPASLIRDEALVSHLKGILELKRKHTDDNDIDIEVREYIPSFPSVIIIDRKYVFISFFQIGVGHPRGISDQSNANEISGLSMSSVLEVFDPSGETARSFENIINGFCTNGGKRITAIGDDIIPIK